MDAGDGRGMEGQDPPGPAKAYLYPPGQSQNPAGPPGPMASGPSVGFHDPRRRKYMKERSKELNIRASYQGLVDELAARRGVRAGRLFRSPPTPPPSPTPPLPAICYRYPPIL